eukprot:m.12543 g.12543  ORF g.12543 m.12543 type:complete len:751 (-) comp6399_c0_seq1:575-2827(-)
MGAGPSSETPRLRDKRGSTASLSQHQSYKVQELREAWVRFQISNGTRTISKKSIALTPQQFRRLTSMDNVEGSVNMSFEMFSQFMRHMYPGDDSFYEKVCSCYDDDDSNEISFQEAAVTINFFEHYSPNEKLNFLFDAFDDDNDDFLNAEEMRQILLQTTSNALFLGQDTSQIRPILNQLIRDLDKNSDGKVSREEWITGGLNTTPLLQILGLDQSAGPNVREGSHEWKAKKFSSSSYCVVCHTPIGGIRHRTALTCNLCSTVVHHDCADKGLAGCRGTCVNEVPADPTPQHHWVMGNGHHKCAVCEKSVKRNPESSLTCSWCEQTVHMQCKDSLAHECPLGSHRDCIVPATGFLVKEETDEKGNTVEKVVSITPLPRTQPVVVFVNSKSGAGQGLRVMTKFRRMLNPRQVCDLAKGGPRAKLLEWATVLRYRIVCCGGDGTVGWVLSELDKISDESRTYRPPIAVIPLGTGNDLARCLGWGGGFRDKDNLDKWLHQISVSQIVEMDRWKLSFTVDESAAKPDDKTDPVPLTIMNNYYSIGVDASIALRFHHERETNPHRFRSRAKNKIFYAQYGAAEAFHSTCSNLQNDIEVTVDGRVLHLPDLEGIAILNIPSMYGGTNLWGNKSSKKYTDQHIGDQLLEIVGIYSSLHVGQIKGGLRQSAKRLGQGANIKIRTKTVLPMQIDGEPWMQAAGTVEINHHNLVRMLRKQDSGQIFHHRSQLARSSVSRKSPEKKRGGSEPLVRAASAME